MKSNWKWIGLAGAAALMLLGGGCSGINASKSVSPLDFLLPGLGGLRVEGAPAPSPEVPLVPHEPFQSVTQSN
jgi:hypothetical protein